MPGFHSFNRVPCSLNRYLLTDVLRGELGFDGFCISDMGAVFETGPAGHAVARDEADISAKCLNAGLDMEMTRRDERAYSVGLAQAVRDGRVSERTLDACVRNVLSVKRRMGLFEQPYIDADILGKIDFGAHRALAREAAAKAANPGGVVWTEPLAGPGQAEGVDMLADWIYTYGTKNRLAVQRQMYGKVRALGRPMPFMPTISPTIFYSGLNVDGTGELEPSQADKSHPVTDFREAPSFVKTSGEAIVTSVSVSSFS